MKDKIYSFLICAPVVLFSLIPPIDFKVNNPHYEAWLMLVMFSAFLGVCSVFLRIPVLIKIFSVFCLINCSCSQVPYISWTSYISIVACIYFYWACLKIKRWDIVFKIVQSLLLLNLFFVLMQMFGKDNLLNFGQKNYVFSICGQTMQLGSVSVVLAAFLLSFSNANIFFPFFISIAAHSHWAFLCASAGLFILLSKKTFAMAVIVFSILIIFFCSYAHHKIVENKSANGRIAVWHKTAELSKRHIFIGYGAGTYKVLFPILSEMPGVPYKSAHNDYMQMMFEFGRFGLLVMLAYLGSLFVSLLKKKKFVLLAGLSMILCSMLVHFPMRLIHTVLPMILFLAYCKFKEIEYDHI